MAVAFVVIPYCLARGLQLMAADDSGQGLRDLNQQSTDTAKIQTQLLASIANNTIEQHTQPSL